MGELRPVLPVYVAADDMDGHECDVELMMAEAEGQVVAVCPGGHYAQVFDPGDEGAMHTDHQPCPGAWWFVEVTDD